MEQESPVRHAAAIPFLREETYSAPDLPQISCGSIPPGSHRFPEGTSRKMQSPYRHGTQIHRWLFHPVPELPACRVPVYRFHATDILQILLLLSQNGWNKAGISCFRLLRPRLSPVSPSIHCSVRGWSLPVPAPEPPHSHKRTAAMPGSVSLGLRYNRSLRPVHVPALLQKSRLQAFLHNMQVYLPEQRSSDFGPHVYECGP